MCFLTTKFVYLAWEFIQQKCRMLATTAKHKAIHLQADQQYLKNVSKMKIKYAKQQNVGTYSVDEKC